MMKAAGIALGERKSSEERREVGKGRIYHLSVALVFGRLLVLLRVDLCTDQRLLHMKKIAGRETVR
jgi:hypothetical protein